MKHALCFFLASMLAMCTPAGHYPQVQQCFALNTWVQAEYGDLNALNFEGTNGKTSVTASILNGAAIVDIRHCNTPVHFESVVGRTEIEKVGGKDFATYTKYVGSDKGVKFRIYVHSNRKDVYINIYE